MTIQPFFAVSAPIARGEVQITRARAFEAAHAYRDPSFGVATRVHGHNYMLTATIAGPIDPATHFLADFRDLDAVLKEATQPLDHHRIDREYAPLRGREACAEAIAAALFAELEPRIRAAIPSARIVAVRLNETADLWADTHGGGDMDLTRAYGFSAAHRLADPQRSDEENARLYGKCARPEPHGHDYRFEVTVHGRPDPQSGLVADLQALDRAVDERVVSVFDHRYLNVEVEPFTTVIPTAERIAERIWQLLAPEVRGLARVVVYETPRSAFAYAGPAA